MTFAIGGFNTVVDLKCTSHNVDVNGASAGTKSEKPEGYGLNNKYFFLVLSFDALNWVTSKVRC